MSNFDEHVGKWERSRAGALGSLALARLEEYARDGARLGEWWTLAPDAHEDAYAKGAPISGKACLRHGARARLGLGLPRLRELENLLWLRAHGFSAPEPIAALATWDDGLPRWQGLVTLRVPDAGSLLQLLPSQPLQARGAACQAMGVSVGRLHAAGFVHRDLYLRNLTVAREPGPHAIGFLDCWRGGPPRGPRVLAQALALVAGRDAAYDLACLFVHLPSLVTREDEVRLFEAYRSERALSDSEARRLFARVGRLRARAAGREKRRNRRDAVSIAESWSPPPAVL